ncbi:MAG TPA: peptidoglycan recognition family protein [Xanthobacteraceae bacterium]|nr:peptidoglycan recognition family protein [Xanthobacteraceae bacterium]
MKIDSQIGHFSRIAMLVVLATGMGTLVKPLSSADSAIAAAVKAQAKPPAETGLSEAARLIAKVREGRFDVPRVELAARLAMAGFDASAEYKLMRENAARELSGRPDGAGEVTAGELHKADEAIAREIQVLRGTIPRPSFSEAARSPGRPQIEGLNIVYLNPLGDPAHANAWKNIIAHQTEGRPGSARREADDQFANPTKRGVTIWVETDGTVYWSTAENVIPTHGEGGDRNDNKYIDNSTTYHSVVKTNSIGVEFIGNFPDVAKPVTPEQVKAWLVLVRFLQERYGIAAQNIYAHNWIDFKDRRYCEGCELATLARNLNYQPSRAMTPRHDYR